MRKRLLSMLMAVCMVFTMLPTAAFAEDSGLPAGISNVVDSGVPVCTCTEKCTPADTENNIAGNIKADCPVCGAEGADLDTVCKGEPLMMMQTLGGTPTEQFSLATGQTYYFDLSGELGTVTNGVSDKIGKINAAVPDKTLHYTPFTYVGTVNAYSCPDNKTPSDRSLFVADYNVSYAVRGDFLNNYNLILGKTFDTNYKLRSLSGGNYWSNGTISPANNEWDMILGKSESAIKNWSGIFSYVQDSFYDGYGIRYAIRGNDSANKWSNINDNNNGDFLGFRPAIEVLDPATLGTDGLKAVTLNLNGGAFKSSSDSIKVVCAGGSFKAPSGEGLTRPSGDNGMGFHWKGSDNNAYDVGDSVPSTVTALTAQWVEAPVKEGEIWNGKSALYFDGGSGTAEKPFEIRTAKQLALLADVINGGAAKTVINGGVGQSYSFLQCARYKLTADIVLNDTKNWVSWANTVPTNKWKPIGTQSNAFSGTFDGNGKTISGIYFNDTTPYVWNGTNGGSFVGLFGYNNGGTIKNVTVAESYIKGYERVGGVVGYSGDKNGTVESCQNHGTVGGYSQVSGIVGNNRWITQNSQNYGSVSGSLYVGGIVGNNEYITKNSQNHGTVSGGGSVGGVVGNNTGYSSQLSGCINSGAVSGTDSGIGGIVGQILNGSVTNNTSLKGLTKDATGNIGAANSPSTSNCFIGHIIGRGAGGTGNVSDSVNAGVVLAPSAAPVAKGGTQQFTATVDNTANTNVTWSIVGGDGKATISDSGLVTTASEAVDGTTYVVKAVLNDDTTKFGMAIVTVVKSPLSIGEVWDGTSTICFAGGKGTADDPYQIATADQLALFADIINDFKWSNYTGGSGGTYDVNNKASRVVIKGASAQNYTTLQSAHYRLISDIVLNNTANWESWASENPNKTTLNKWKPIGTQSNAFSGTFDGNGKTISGMYFNDTSNAEWNGTTGGNRVGLFGHNFRGTIKNLIVAKSNIFGYAWIGGVVGHNESGTVKNCLNDGAVTGSAQIGGVVGRSDMPSSDPYVAPIIENCKNGGKVSIAYTGICVGGVVGVSVGYSDSIKAQVKNCISPKGLTKEATGDFGAGNFPAGNYNSLGHIIGQSTNTDTTDSSSNFNAGVSVTPSSPYVTKGSKQQFTAAIGGLETKDVIWSIVAGDGNASISDSGELTLTTNALDGTHYIVKAVSKTDAMQFGIATVIVGYPTGTAWDGTSAHYFEGGIGTEEDPYQIRTAEQLYLLSSIINRLDYNKNNSSIGGFIKVTQDQPATSFYLLQRAHYKLTADIKLNDTTNWESWANTAPTNKWKPIGNSNHINYNFIGTFDGNGKTISGMYFNDTSDQKWDGISGGINVGLFGYNVGTIKNVTVAESYIMGRSEIGGVVGLNSRALNSPIATVENCQNSGTVSGFIETDLGSSVGGVVGYNLNAKVGNSRNSGTVSGNMWVGGIAGHIGEQNTTGSPVDNCQNSGAVSGNILVGGIVGYNHNATVTNCTSPKGLTKDATGDFGEIFKPTNSHYSLGHIIGNGGNGTNNNSSGNLTVGVTVTPASETVAQSGTQQFTAKIGETATTDVTWCIVGGDGKATIDKNGLVTIASDAVAGTNYAIKAVSTADKTKYGTATVTVGAPSPAAPVITTTSLPNVLVGSTYSQTLAATGYPAPTWSISSGSLAQGLSLNETTGEITGTPTAKGTSTFTVKATNASGSDSKELSITVSSAEFELTATPEKVDFGTLSVGYKEPAPKTITITNTGTQDISLGYLTSLTIDSQLEITGGHFNSNNFILKVGESEVLTAKVNAGGATGTYKIDIVVRRNKGSVFPEMVRVPVTVTVNEAPKITTTSLPNGTLGTAYSQTLVATGTTPIAWSVSEGTLPAGLSLEASTGKITGTPTAIGTYTFTIKATNASGSDTKQLSITVTSPITSLSVSPATVTVKKTKTQLFTANVEGTGDKTVKWSVEGGTNSSIDASGVLTVGGRETATTLTVKATSTVDSSKFGTATVTVAAAPKVCTVTFDSDGGSAIPAISGIEEGSTIKLPNNPTKANHRFDGWYTQINGSGAQFTSATTVTNSITIYAKWTKLVTVSGIVVEEEGETPISGATVTLSPAYGTTAFTTGADGKFSFANIPEDYFTVTATFADTSSVTVNVTGNYENVKIVNPKPYLTITTQPQDSYIIKGIAGQSAVFKVLGKRTPLIADSIAYEWWWLNGNTPAGAIPDVKMSGSGSQMTINQGNGNIPDRGNYKLYALAYTNDTVPLEAYSRVATLKVVGVNTIEGVVKKDNAPVENAKVELVYADGAWPYGSVAKTSSINPQTTIADGKYKFELVPDGKYKLIITLPGGGIITDGPHDFPKTDPDKPIDIIVPDKASIQISGQPQDATVKNGSNVTLSVNAAATDGSVLTYQWYKSTKNSNNGGTAIDGATAKTYTPTTADKGTTYYYCMVSGGSLETVTTRSAKITVFTYGTIAGTVQTKDKQPIKDAKVELINIDTPVQTGFTTSQNPQTTLADGKYKFIEVPDGMYKLKVTLPGGEVFEVQPIDVPNVTPVIPLTPPDKSTISIASQPKGMTVALNDTAEFSVVAGVSNGGTVLYQWYQSTTNSTTGGKVINGATASNYRAPTDAKGVTYYYCVVQATGAQSVTSNIAKLTVRDTLYMTIAGEVKDDKGAAVKDAIVTLTPAAGISANPQTTVADGKYKFEMLPIQKYIITVKLPGGGSIEIPVDPGDPDGPNPYNPNIDPGIVVPSDNKITIGTQPKDMTMTTAMSGVFTVKATASKSDTLTYQWYKNTTNANSGGTKLDGKTEATLNLDKQPEGESYYYCVISSTGATDVATDAAKLTVTKANGDNGDLDGGVVDDEDGNPVKDATVKLMKNGTDGVQFGSTVTTGEDGKFEFTSIPYGSYSLVAQKDTSTVTRQITIKSASITENLIMPSGAKITKVVIDGINTPSAAVENLEAMFTDEDNTIALQPGATVEIKLVVEKQDSPSDKGDIDAALAENQHVGIYLDAKLIKTVNGTVTEDGTENIQPQAGQNLRIVLDLPTTLQGKTGYEIIRSHTENTVTDVRTILPDHDNVLHTLSFDADAFSTYAVVYTQAPKYSVTVIGSQVGADSGIGLYEAGQTVSIQAGSKSGYSFAGWTSNDSVSFASASNTATTFTMPARNVTLTANWKSNGGNGGDDHDDDDGSSSGSSSESGSSGGKNQGGSSDSSSNSDSNSGSGTDTKDNSDDLNKSKDDALKNLADERQKAIDALPDSLTDDQRKAAMDEIDRIYMQAVTNIQNADSTGAISDITDKAFSNLADVVSGVGEEMPTQSVAGNGKPFVLLSAALAAASIPGAVLAWRRREDEETNGDNRKRRRSQIIATALAAAAILLFLLTTGWNGITLANWWTIAVAISAAGSLLFTLRNK